jgi:argininosuccinate lyase
MANVWNGVFSKRQKDALFDYNSGENIALDAKLVKYDIEGSMAHVVMLARQKILQPKAAREILSALSKVQSEYEGGKFVLKKELEDVHMNVEARTIEISTSAKMMHTARSRNDQVNLDGRLYMRDAILGVCDGIFELQEALYRAGAHRLPMVAYTHTRVAQPISTAFWAGSYIEGFSRDCGRLLDEYLRVNQNPLGAAAVAGTGWPIDRKYTAELLGFEGVQKNALDATGSRGEIEAGVVGALALVMVRASRLSEELLWLSEKKLLEIPEEYCTGSSIMPQKKNADVLELVRGRASRVISNQVHLLSLLKGLMSGYNSDSQESKYAMMMAFETTRQSLGILAGVVAGLAFDKKRIEEELEEGYASATALADMMAQNGMAFRDAHKITGEIAREFAKEKRKLSTLSADELKKKARVSVAPAKLREALSVDKAAKFGFDVDEEKRKGLVAKVNEERKKLAGARKKLHEAAKAV